MTFITSPTDPWALKGTIGIPIRAASFLQLGFNDISSEDPAMLPPTKEAVMAAIKFSEGKEDLLICCHAGVSRSSGMAYVIQTYRTNDPVKALEILDQDKHFPNRLVVKHGSELLNKPEMNSIIEEFHRWGA